MIPHRAYGIISYQIHEVIPYISWPYFFHAWGFRSRFAAVANQCDCPACQQTWFKSFNIKEQREAEEAAKLFIEAKDTLNFLEGQIETKACFKLCEANSDEDDLVLDKSIRLPLLRQQTIHSSNEPYLCLSDFIRPIRSGISDTVGVFAATIDDSAVTDSVKNDPMRMLLIQTLSDRLVEATVERTHERIRKEIWGYAPNENLPMAELLSEKFQGIRPAVGYPSLPDQSINFILDSILDFSQIGITITENGAMKPHASVSGLMISHPQSKYFAVGKIGEDQLADYAQRRGLPLDRMRKFLAANL